MSAITPYLIFSGQCEEAVKFYCSIFQGEITSTHRYGDSPNDQTPVNWKNKIMHTQFKLAGSAMMASDGPQDFKTTVGDNVELYVSLKTKTDVDAAFKKLSEGGKVVQVPADTFWGAYFGMCSDRYGNRWMLSANL